jgi:hypothetical protein
MGCNETPLHPTGVIMKNKIAATKKFVSDHRVAIAVLTTTTVLVSLQVRNAKVLNEFLKEHNLYDAYYAMDEV